MSCRCDCELWQCLTMGTHQRVRGQVRQQRLEGPVALVAQAEELVAQVERP